MATWNSRGLRGSTLEDLINRTNEQYAGKKLALIQKIPTPKFLVFYNGLDHKVPDRMELRLSDAYENPVDEPDLELKVTMLNINAGHNEELMNSCHVLQEYARYVARVRKYVAEMPLDEAVERAVTECIRDPGRIFEKESRGGSKSEHF